jgi:stage V sporulation protein S
MEQAFNMDPTKNVKKSMDVLQERLLVDDIIRVSANSQPRLVAGAIAHSLREKPSIHVQAIGMIAVNQAVKAAIIARTYLHADGLDLFIVPNFTTVQIENQQRIALRFTIYVKDGENLS